MKTQKKSYWLRKRVLSGLVIAIVIVENLFWAPVPAFAWGPTLLANTQGFQIIDDSDPTANLSLKFGDTINEEIYWNRANARFQFTDDLHVDGNLTASGTLTINGNVTLKSTIRLNGVTYTFPTSDGSTSGKVLKSNAAGQLSWSTDATGAGGGLTQAEADARYTNISGDRMTGSLIIADGSGLAASGSIRTEGNFTINEDNGAVDAVLTFGSDVIAETFSFLNSEDRFEFSDDLNITGTLTSSGNLIVGGSQRTKGNLNVQGNMSGASTTISNLRNCNTIDTNAAGVLACGTDEGGAGGGMTFDEASSYFVNDSGDTMTGGLTISKTSWDIVKTTTGTSNSTDFSLAGSTLTNVTSSNDQISINEGTIPNGALGTFSGAVSVTAVAAGAGAHSILRDDGAIIILHGGGALTASRWDGHSPTMTSVTATVTSGPGAGSISLKRPDGRYLVIHGGGTAGVTSLFDPWGVTAAAAGPAVCGGAAITTGTNAFLLQTGNYVIMCGGFTAWGIYNPTANTYTAGTAVGVAFGAGAHAIQRDDGTFLVFAGGNTTTHWIYNPFAAATGTWTLNPIVSNAPTITTGAFSIRRSDGKFLVMGGAVNTSSIYDPKANGVNSGAGNMTAQSGAGFGPTLALADAAQAVWRQDGKYLLIIGAGSTVTNIIDPSKSDTTQFTAGPTLPGAIGAGAHFVERPNGRYQLIRGGATTTTDIYDIGFIRGGDSTVTQGLALEHASYETECITSTNLSQSGSRLFWTANQEGTVKFQVRTGNGSCSGSYKDIQNNGDLIRLTGGDNRIQVKVFFKRPLPNFADQEWKVRRGLSQTRYRRVNFGPALFDLTIKNTSMLHRTQFEFGNSTNTSGPVLVNMMNDSNRNLGLQLSWGIGYGSTINATNPQFYNGVFGTHTALTTTSTAGTVVMRRPDNKFIVISGNAAANAQVYDPELQTFTALGTAPAAAAGLGAHAFKRPDGKFLIILGGATTTTSIFDPVANTFTAGPVLTAAAGRGAIAIPLPNGRVLILHGNFTNTSSIYDPYQNVMVAGPLTSAVVGGGSMAIPRPNGTFLVVLGVATEACTALNTVTNNFDPYTMTFVATGSPAITTGVGPGAFAFQRSDGQWVIVHGGGTVTTCAGVTRTQIYNPITNKSVVGPVLSGVAQHGAHAVQRPDGTWLVVHGGALTTTSIYLEKAGAFTTEGLGNIGQFIAGPALVTAASAGSISFQRDDGKYVTITGNAGAVVQQYDGGWIYNGIYKSEEIKIPNMDSATVLNWRATPDMGGISVEVRTATGQLMLQTKPARELGVSGSPINPAANETWLQVNFNFKRTFPSYSGIYEDVWYNGGSPNLFTQRKIPTPVLQEFSVNKDSDLLNLKSNNNSVLRVNSNGDVYSSINTAFNAGGADLAERYTSKTPLEGGQVVAVDPGQPHAVRPSSHPFENDLLGVVSLSPGFVAGAYTKDSYPIALIGRVPVNITDEGGSVVVGDRITSSTLPGYGMKALMKGRVLGMALESKDFTNAPECPYTAPLQKKRRCTTVMMLVDLSDYPGPTR